MNSNDTFYLRVIRGGYYVKIDADSAMRLLEMNVRKAGGGYFNVAKKGSADVIPLSRFVLGERFATSTGVLADHVNHDIADNRRANLRWATPSQNQFNKICPTAKRRFPYKGIDSRRLKSGKEVFRVFIQIHGRGFHFRCPGAGCADAAAVYDCVALRYCPAFAILNFPERRSEYAEIIKDKICFTVAGVRVDTSKIQSFLRN